MNLYVGSLVVAVRSTLSHVADVSEFPLRILMQRPAFPFVISNAVRHVAEHWYPSSGVGQIPADSVPMLSVAIPLLAALRLLGSAHRRFRGCPVVSGQSVRGR
jgi:hypothetical protein